MEPTDDTTCNYNALATDSDGSCDYPDMYYNCAGQCINDVDADGVCDELEVEGCQDEAYDNYDASATDAGTCTGLLGCTDSEFAEYYDGFPDYHTYVAAAGVGYKVELNPSSCTTKLIIGCTNPAAYNYNPEANLSGYGHHDSCLIY